MDEMLFPEAPNVRATKDLDHDTLSLFGDLTPPDIRTPAPSAPGSESSSEAARELDASGAHGREIRRVLIWFAAQSQARTRHECAEALYPNTGGLGSACGRVNDLVFAGWLEEVGRNGKRATLSLTRDGRNAAAQYIKRSGEAA